MPEQLFVYMPTSVHGLLLMPDWVSEAEEQALMAEIDAQPWITDYQRRLQYYGYRNELEKPYALVAFPVPMPPAIAALAGRLQAQHIVEQLPNQVIVNEYLPGEGLRPHKDRNYYQNQICGVNLGSGCIMRFEQGAQVVDLAMPRRSVYVMQDEVRHKWMHSVPARKNDRIDGVLQARQRRLSITYRSVHPHRVKPLNPQGRVAGMLQGIFGIGVSQ